MQIEMLDLLLRNATREVTKSFLNELYMLYKKLNEISPDFFQEHAYSGFMNLLGNVTFSFFVGFNEIYVTEIKKPYVPTDNDIDDILKCLKIIRSRYNEKFLSNSGENHNATHQ